MFRRTPTLSAVRRSCQPSVSPVCSSLSAAASLVGRRALSSLPASASSSPLAIPSVASSPSLHRSASSAPSTSTKAFKVGLIGARGFTGSNLIKLIESHPYMTLSHVSSRQNAGQPLEGYTKSNLTYSNLSPADVGRMEEDGEVDAWVMALPNGVCKPFVDAIEGAVEKGGKGIIIDLGADYRFEDGWTYGLPELYSRDAIRSSKRIANPGCFATSTQLLLAPLLPYLDAANPPSVFAVSGYSGAGTKTGPADKDGKPTTVSKVSPDSLRTAIKPYSLTDHIHEREASHHLSKLSPSGPFKLAFVPSVGPWFAGILSTASIPLNKELRFSEIQELYKEKYGDEKMVTLLEPSKGVVDVRDVEGQHGWTMGGVQVHSEGKRVVVVGALDNLLKGAATQCIQNLNLALGYGEYDGIPL